MSAAPPELLEARSGSRQGKLAVARLSGIEEALDPALLGYLEAIREREISFFFSDCFKMITRHPRKLYRVVNFVLGHGVPVVTSNYFIAPDYVSQRTPLLRPARHDRELPAKLENYDGVSPRHREVLQELAESLDGDEP